VAECVLIEPLAEFILPDPKLKHLPTVRIELGIGPGGGWTWAVHWNSALVGGSYGLIIRDLTGKPWRPEKPSLGAALAHAIQEVWTDFEGLREAARVRRWLDGLARLGIA